MSARKLRESGVLDKNDENRPFPAKNGKEKANGTLTGVIRYL